MQLRTQAEFEAANGVKAPAGKRYFQWRLNVPVLHIFQAANALHPCLERVAGQLLVKTLPLLGCDCMLSLHLCS